MRRERSKIEKFQSLLQLVFFVATILMIICYFLCKGTDHPYLFLIPAGIAVVARVVVYILNFSKKNKIN